MQTLHKAQWWARKGLKERQLMQNFKPNVLFLISTVTTTFSFETFLRSLFENHGKKPGLSSKSSVIGILMIPGSLIMVFINKQIVVNSKTLTNPIEINFSSGSGWGCNLNLLIRIEGNFIGKWYSRTISNRRNRIGKERSPTKERIVRKSKGPNTILSEKTKVLFPYLKSFFIIKWLFRGLWRELQ